MSFSTNKYTRPVLLNNLRSVSARSYSNLNSFASALSPRAGIKSAQIAALKSVVGSRTLTNVFANSTSGTLTKKALISLIKNS